MFLLFIEWCDNTQWTLETSLTNMDPLEFESFKLKPWPTLALVASPKPFYQNSFCKLNYVSNLTQTTIFSFINWIIVINFELVHKRPNNNHLIIILFAYWTMCQKISMLTPIKLNKLLCFYIVYFVVFVCMLVNCLFIVIYLYCLDCTESNILFVKRVFLHQLP